MLLTLSTDTAVHIGGVGAVLEVVSAGCRQGGIERRRPLFVSLCQPPNPVRREVEVAEHLAERLPLIDRIEELSPKLDW
jgi:hypothetical protein